MNLLWIRLVIAASSGNLGLLNLLSVDEVVGVGLEKLQSGQKSGEYMHIQYILHNQLIMSSFACANASVCGC